MLSHLNRQLEKLMPFMTPICVILGVLLSGYIKGDSFLIPWIFAFITFSGSLTSSFDSFKDAIIHPMPVILLFITLHLLMPSLAWGIAHVFFSRDPLTMTGLILAALIPTGITSFIWAGMLKGHTTLALSVILIDTLLSPLIVPYGLSFFVGQKIELNVLSLMVGLLRMIVIPSLLAMFLNQMTKGKMASSISPKLAPFSKIGLGLVVMLNGAVVAPYLRHFSIKLLSIAMTVFLLAFCGYLISFFIGRLFKQDHETVIAMTFIGGMRNISAGSVIAVAYFPPSVVVPVVVGMLFQQIIASIWGIILKGITPLRTQGQVATKR